MAVSDLKLLYPGKSKLENYIINSGEKKHISKISGIYENRFEYLYRKMIKLKDGRVLMLSKYSGFEIAEIREQIKNPTNRGASGIFIISGNFIITFSLDTKLKVLRLYDD